MSYGEDHQFDSELKRRELDQMAGLIGEAVAGAGNPGWVLVAPQPILARLRDALPAACRDRLLEAPRHLPAFGRRAAAGPTFWSPRWWSFPT